MLVSFFLSFFLSHPPSPSLLLQIIADAVRTTLGPRGMDKLIVNSKGEATISNDGATIMKLLEIVHPAAKTLVDIAKSQVKKSSGSTDW